MVPLPVNGGRDLTDANFTPTAPTEEYEGPDGEFWVEMNCVDCARVANQRRRVSRRKDVERWLTWALARADKLSDEEITDLHATFRQVLERRNQPQA